MKSVTLAFQSRCYFARLGLYLRYEAKKPMGKTFGHSQRAAATI
jgi:hypothetical protein